MLQRALGTSGPSVSALGLGLMGMSEFYGATDDEQSVATIHRALDLGVNFLDTADIYGSGHNEQLLGRALAGRRREEAVVATKFGARRQGDVSTVDSTPEYARQAVDASLARLGIDHIDVYYLHRRDPKVPIEDTVGALADLVAQGKIRHIGLSEVSAGTLRRPTPCIRSPRCRASTHCGSAGLRPRCCPQRASSVSPSCRTRRSAAAS